MKRFSAGAQATYFAILAEFNSAHFPSSLSLSTRDLKELAGLKSVASAHECRNVLKNNHLIDFSTKSGTTIYQLLSEHLPNKNTSTAELQPNDSRTPKGLFAIHATRVDVEKEKKDNLSIDSAGAREKRAGETPRAVFATPKNREEEKESGKLEEIDELQEYWESEIRGGKLTFEHLSKLEEYLKTKGLDWLKEAMKETANANSNPRGSSPKLLFGVIAQKEKGEIKVERKPEPPKRSYTVPVRTGKEEWNIDDGDEE